MDLRVLAWMLLLVALVAAPVVYMLALVAARLPH
jgi:hypothetical protein